MVEQSGYFDAHPIDRFFRNHGDLLSYLFKKYAMEDESKTKRNFAQSFDVQVRSADAASLRLSYASFFKLAVKFGIYPEIDNRPESNFRLMRVFLHAAGLVPPEEGPATESSQGGADEEDEEMSMQQQFISAPNMSFISAVNTTHNMPRRGMRSPQRNRRQQQQQRQRGLKKAKKVSFSEHLSSKTEKFRSIFAANADSPVHNDKPFEIRQLLNSVGENPLPGEFQLLMKLLKDAKARTNLASPQRSKSMSKKKIRLQAIRDSIVTEEEFISSWTESATLAQKTATLKLTYDAFKICIGTCFFFMYVTKFRNQRRKSMKSKSSIGGVSSIGSSRDSSTLVSELDELVDTAAAFASGEVGASFQAKKSFDPSSAASTSFDELLLYALKDLGKAHQDVGPESLLMGTCLRNQAPQTPDEQLHQLRLDWKGVLVSVFQTYTRIWSSTNNILSKDAFLVFLKDSNLFKKVPQSVVSNLIDVDLDTEMDDYMDAENFVEANNILMKENWVAKMQEQNANQEQLIWNNAVESKETKASYDQLHGLFDLYEMPSRVSNFQKSVLRVKVAEAVTAEIGSTVSHSIHQHPTQYVDFWSGVTVKISSTKGDSSSHTNDSSEGSGNFTNYHKRADVLALIVDRSVTADGVDDGDGHEEKKMTVDEEEEESGEGGKKKEPELSQEHRETVRKSNLGRSILDMAMRLSVRDDKTQPKGGEDGGVSFKKDGLRPPPVDTSVFGDQEAKGMSTNKTSASAGVAFRTPSQNDPASDLLTTKSPMPPPFNSFRRSGSGNKKKHRKVFKKSFGLSRGIQPFQPRLTTNSLQRKKTEKKMTEKCDQIMQETRKEVMWRIASTTQNSQGTVDLANDPHFLTMVGGGDVEDGLANASGSPTAPSHPSYKLFDEAIKIRRIRPEQSIALCEKALMFSQSMQHEAGYEHRLNIYEDAVGTCLYLKRYEHAADLMEGQLELIRQSTTDRKDEVKVLNQLGKVHYVMENYDESETCHALQQSLAHSIFDHFGEMHAFYGQGMALYALRHLEDACEMFKKYLNNAEECSEDRDVAIACGRMGLTLLELGKLEESFMSFKKQITKLRKIFNESPGDNAVLSSLASAFGNLGKVYRKWEKLPLSSNAFAKQLKLAEDLGFRKMICESLYDLASVNVEMKLGVSLENIPKYVGFGGSEGEELWLEHLWKQSGWAKHWALFRRLSGRDKGFSSVAVGESVVEESIEMLRRVIEDGAGSQELLWKSLVDAGSLMYLVGDSKGGKEHFARAKELLGGMAMQQRGNDSSDEEEDDDEGGPLGRKVDWDNAEYELKMKRIKVLLLEGVYLMMMRRWGEAAKPLGEVVGGDLAKNTVFIPLLGGGGLMYGWCLHKLRRKEEAEMWLGKSLKCFDIARDGVGKAAAMLALVEIRVGPGGGGRGRWTKLRVEELDMLVDIFGKCFDIGNEFDIVELQVVSLERLSEAHEALGDNDVAAELAKRAMKLRQATGDVAGMGHAQAILTTKFGKSMVEKNAVWSEVGLEEKFDEYS